MGIYREQYINQCVQKVNIRSLYINDNTDNKMKERMRFSKTTFFVGNFKSVCQSASCTTVYNNSYREIKSLLWFKNCLKCFKSLFKSQRFGWNFSLHQGRVKRIEFHVLIFFTTERKRPVYQNICLGQPSKLTILCFYSCQCEQIYFLSPRKARPLWEYINLAVPRR